MLKIIAAMLLWVIFLSPASAAANCETVHKITVGNWGDEISPYMANLQVYVAELREAPDQPTMTEEACLDATYKEYSKAVDAYVALMKGEIDTFVGSAVIPFFYEDTGVTNHPIILGWLSNIDFAYGGIGTSRLSVKDTVGKTMLLVRCTPRPGDVNYDASGPLPKLSYPDVLFRLRMEQAIKNGEVPADTQVICLTKRGDKDLATSQNVVFIKVFKDNSSNRIKEACTDENLLTAYVAEQEGSVCANNAGKMANYINHGELVTFPQEHAVFIRERILNDPERYETAKLYQGVFDQANKKLRRDPRPILQALAEKYPKSPIGQAVQRGEMEDLVEIGQSIWPDRCPTREDYRFFIDIFKLKGHEDTFFDFQCNN